jgi:hypothetical protein
MFLPVLRAFEKPSSWVTNSIIVAPKLIEPTLRLVNADTLHHRLGSTSIRPLIETLSSIPP